MRMKMKRRRRPDRVVSALQPTWLIGLGRARTRDQPVSRRKDYPDRFHGSPPRSSMDAMPDLVVLSLPCQVVGDVTPTPCAPPSKGRPLAPAEAYPAARGVRRQGEEEEEEEEEEEDDDDDVDVDSLDRTNNFRPGKRRVQECLGRKLASQVSIDSKLSAPDERSWGRWRRSRRIWDPETPGSTAARGCCQDSPAARHLAGVPNGQAWC